MGELARSSAAALWVTALGVIFAGSQLFIMAMSTSLESVNRWPVLTLEYRRVAAGTGEAYELTAQNSGTGPALINAVNWNHEGKKITSWREAMTRFGATETDLLRWERVSDRVLPPGGIVKMATVGQSEGGQKVWEAWRKHTAASHFAICYCTALNESWVGRWASTIAGMPVCWIADRRSLRPQPAPDNTCSASTFTN
jgi:hypothetical protein